MEETEDRYSELERVIHQVLSDPDFPDGPHERFEVTLLASGEATWRVWPARAGEPIGGYYESA